MKKSISTLLIITLLLGMLISTTACTKRVDTIAGEIQEGKIILAGKPELESESEPAETIIVIQDENLEAVIRQNINKPTGELTDKDIEKIIELDAAGKNITSLVGLEYAIKIQTLVLSDNQIESIEPLLENKGIGQGDQVNLENNPLLPDEQNATAITKLKVRGVVLNYTEATEVVEAVPTPAPELDPVTEPEPAAEEETNGERVVDVPLKEIVVIIPDEKLEEAIRETIKKRTGDITAYDMAQIAELSAHGKGIVDLTGLEYAMNLTKLWLYTNRISDITPLEGLTNLTNLWVSDNPLNQKSGEIIEELRGRGVNMR